MGGVLLCFAVAGKAKAHNWQATSECGWAATYGLGFMVYGLVYFTVYFMAGDLEFRGMVYGIRLRVSGLG